MAGVGSISSNVTSQVKTCVRTADKAYVAAIIAPAGNYRDRALNSLATLPPFTPVLNRLLATISSEDASIQKIGAIIEKDTVIAGNILKLVNSAMYGRRGVVTSILHAASLLGMDRLRNAVLGMSVTRMWTQLRMPPTWSTARFNLHSVATALLADLIAQSGGVQFPEGAFLAGLFHDLGQLLVVFSLPDEYQAIVRLYGEGKLSWLNCERQVLGFTHAELSAEAVFRWHLPDPIRVAVFECSAQPPSAATGAPSLASVLHCSDLYVNASGISIERDRSPADASSENPFGPFALGDNLPALLEEFHAQFDVLSGFFH